MPLLVPGNIDLKSRPIVRNPDGSYSTVRSMSFNVDGREILVPTITPDGRNLSPQEAVDRFRRTGEHLGQFSTPEEANAYAQQLHNEQELMYKKKALEQFNIGAPNNAPNP